MRGIGSARPEEYGGEFEIDGHKINWRPNAIGGFYISFGANGLIHFNGKPTEQRVRDMVIGYVAGLIDGKRVGRQMLQNEFRNLMNVGR